MEKPHKKLDLWHWAMDIVIEVYKVTEDFPRTESYGLISQIRKSAVSIPSNIAEGAARQTRKEFIQFLYVAQGSLSELDTQLEIARQMRYLRGGVWERLDKKMDRADKLLSGLIRQQKSLHASHFTPNDPRG